MCECKSSRVQKFSSHRSISKTEFSITLCRKGQQSLSLLNSSNILTPIPRGEAANGANPKDKCWLKWCCGRDWSETDQILVPVLPSYWILVHRHSEACLQGLLFCYVLELLNSKVKYLSVWYSTVKKSQTDQNLGAYSSLEGHFFCHPSSLSFLSHWNWPQVLDFH